MTCERSTEEIQGDIAALKRAIGRGINSYSYDGRNVVYRNMDEMKEALSSLEAELGQTGTTRETRFYASVSKGY